MRVSPSARTVPELKAVALGLKLLDKGIKKDLNSSVRTELNPLWKFVVGSHISTNADDQAIFGKGARIAPGNPSRALAGTSRRPLSGGLIPAEEARAWEFGSPNPNEYAEYERIHPKSLKTHYVRRRTKKQLPPAKRKGRIVYPAWAEMGPRLVSLWVQIVVRNIHESLEKR